MKKGKYIDYNIILACLSHKRKAQVVQVAPLPMPSTGQTRIILLRERMEEGQVA